MPIHDLAREYSTTTGTGSTPVVLSGAVPGCNTWEDAGVVNGEVVRYGLITYDAGGAPVDMETGLTAYNASTNTVARGTVDASTNGGSWVDLTGSAQVYICPNKRDMPLIASYTGDYESAIADSTDGHQVSIDDRIVDEFDFCTLAADVLTANYSSYIMLSANLYVSGSSAFNGYVHLHLDTNNDADWYRGYTTAMGISTDMITIGPILVNVTGTQAISMTVDNHLGEAVDFVLYDITLEWRPK